MSKQEMTINHHGPATPAAQMQDERGLSSAPLDHAGDAWFVVHSITPRIFAIAEPHYYQGNFSYLIVGGHTALLLDAGASTRHNIAEVVARLTDKPCALLPTHLHFDHLGGLAHFNDVWLADTPTLAAFKQAPGHYLVPTSYTLGHWEGLGPTRLSPARLIPLGSDMDLGGATLKVVPAPGHCPDEIVVYDHTDNVLFTGDYLYPKRLYSSDTAAYAASTREILSLVNKNTLLLGAHPDRLPATRPPVMPISDLEDLHAFFARLAAGGIQPTPYADERSAIQSARIYTVNDRISFLEDIVWSDGTAFKH